MPQDTISPLKTAGLASWSARRVAYDVLLRFELGIRSAQGNSLTRLPQAQVALDRLFKSWGGTERDRRFSFNLVYGVLRDWWALDVLIKQYSKLPFERLTPSARVLLRLGFYQLYGLSSVPSYAALSSTLALADELGETKKSKALLSGVLQTFLRQGMPLPEPSAYWPSWWATLMDKQYEPEQRLAIEQALRSPLKRSIRINTLKTTVSEYLNLLETHGLEATVHAQVPEVVILGETEGAVTSLPGYDDGLFYVQNPSSAMVVHWANPQSGQTVIDVCAAPGSKTTHAAINMLNTGLIMALDKSESRLKRLQENVDRLGLSIIKPMVVDATACPSQEIPLGDWVLVDAPCSATGTLSKHPEVLLRFEPSQLPGLVVTQQTLLKQAAQWVKPGGSLMYSTCSLLKSENEAHVDWFLEQHREFKLIGQRRIAPSSIEEGFFMVRFERT